MGSRDSSVGAVTRLPAGQRRDRCWIPCRGKRIVSNPQRPDGFWGPSRTGSALPGMKRPRREADSCCLVLLLRISGAVPPLLHVTLWRDQRNFILYFLNIYAKVIFMSTEGIKKLYDSIRILTVGTIKKTYRDLLQRRYFGGGGGIFICI